MNLINFRPHDRAACKISPKKPYSYTYITDTLIFVIRLNSTGSPLRIVGDTSGDKSQSASSRIIPSRGFAKNPIAGGGRRWLRLEGACFLGSRHFLRGGAVVGAAALNFWPFLGRLLLLLLPLWSYLNVLKTPALAASDFLCACRLLRPARHVSSATALRRRDAAADADGEQSF